MYVNNSSINLYIIRLMYYIYCTCISSHTYYMGYSLVLKVETKLLLQLLLLLLLTTYWYCHIHESLNLYLVTTHCLHYHNLYMRCISDIKLYFSKLYNQLDVYKTHEKYIYLELHSTFI